MHETFVIKFLIGLPSQISILTGSIQVGAPADGRIIPGVAPMKAQLLNPSYKDFASND